MKTIKNSPIGGKIGKTAVGERNIICLRVVLVYKFCVSVASVL